MKRTAFLAINCPKSAKTQNFKNCNGCSFNSYESLTEYAVHCDYRKFINETNEKLKILVDTKR